MILSNEAIFKAMDEGRPILRPEPTPRTPQHNSTSCPYNNNAVDLKLGDIIRVPTGGPFTIDLMQPGSLAEFIEAHSQERKLTSEQPYPLKPYKFVLGLTHEWVELPIGKEPLAARIEGKSSRARCGLLVHFTAPTVHAGWRGHLTLEMINLGPCTFTLSPQMPIAQLILEPVIGNIHANPSVFQNQTTPQGTGK
jgi:dCTP deaminase